MKGQELADYIVVWVLLTISCTCLVGMSSKYTYKDNYFVFAVLMIVAAVANAIVLIVTISYMFR